MNTVLNTGPGVWELRDKQHTLSAAEMADLKKKKSVSLVRVNAANNSSNTHHTHAHAHHTHTALYIYVQEKYKNASYTLNSSCSK